MNKVELRLKARLQKEEEKVFAKVEEIKNIKPFSRRRWSSGCHVSGRFTRRRTMRANLIHSNSFIENTNISASKNLLMLNSSVDATLQELSKSSKNVRNESHEPT